MTLLVLLDSSDEASSLYPLVSQTSIRASVKVRGATAPSNTSGGGNIKSGAGR